MRTALTMDLWEALNDGWRHLSTIPHGTLHPGTAIQLLDWVRQQSTARIHGAIESTLLRSAGYHFTPCSARRIERADMTLRLLDVKYYVLLPETEVVGGSHDHQPVVLASSTRLSARRAFHWSYKGDYSPWKIADFLILNRLFPRSRRGLLCRRSQEHLERAGPHVWPAPRMPLGSPSEMVARLEDVADGRDLPGRLHEFVEGAILRTNRLASEINRAYHF